MDSVKRQSVDDVRSRSSGLVKTADREGGFNLCRSKDCLLSKLSMAFLVVLPSPSEARLGFLVRRGPFTRRMHLHLHLTNSSSIP